MNGIQELDRKGQEDFKQSGNINLIDEIITEIIKRIS